MRAVGAASTPGLHCLGGWVSVWVWKGGGGSGLGEGCTWPPEKPTATTPSSSALERNFGGMVDGAVMIAVFQRIAVVGGKVASLQYTNQQIAK